MIDLRPRLPRPALKTACNEQQVLSIKLNLLYYIWLVNVNFYKAPTSLYCGGTIIFLKRKPHKMPDMFCDGGLHSTKIMGILVYASTTKVGSNKNTCCDEVTTFTTIFVLCLAL